MSSEMDAMGEQGVEPTVAGPVAVERGVCALEGCVLPLPPMEGRGRRPKYCSKAHADQASRDRRTADTLTVDEPLARAEALARTLPLDAVADQIAQLRDFLEAAQDGALGRVRHAEAETVAARQMAADADARA